METAWGPHYYEDKSNDVLNRLFRTASDYSRLSARRQGKIYCAYFGCDTLSMLSTCCQYSLSRRLRWLSTGRLA